MLLPIVERELRVRARSRGTFRVRTAAVLLAIGVGWIPLLVAGDAASGSTGKTLFRCLSILGMFLCLFEGARHASDSLSGEKRDGTMGLLFLTDLSGYDVVLGKLTVISINLFYALLGMLPVLGLCLLMGGVTGTQFAQVSVLLLNALFFAVSCGMLISAISREEKRAFWRTFFLMVGVMVALPLLGLMWLLPARVFAGGGAGWWLFHVPGCVAQASPWVGLHAVLSGGVGMGRFWGSFVVLQGLSWLFLLVASRKLPTAWQEGAVEAPVSEGEWPGEGGGAERVGGGVKSRDWERRRLAGMNPVTWLAMRGEGSGAFAWLVVVMAGWALVLSLASSSGWATLVVLMLPFMLLLKIAVACHAVRLFRDSRRDGAMEMLLSTPLTEAEIIQGQLGALRRLFLAPLITLLILQVLTVILIELDFERGSFNSPPGYGGLSGPWMISGYAVVSFVTGLLAVAYLGMYMALRLKKGTGAVSLTVLWAAVLPQLGVCFLPGVDIGIHILILCLARAGMRGRLRGLASPEG